MYILIFGIFLVTYLVFIAFLIYGWDQISEEMEKPLTFHPIVTIIIVVRNEEKGILALLQDLEKQSYPIKKFEVFIFNDNSTDKTSQIIEAFSTKSQLNITLFHLPSGKSAPKKEAIHLGVQNAKGVWIMITDGDCRVPVGWISTYINYYLNKEVDFIFGPVSFIKHKSILNKIMTIEFASLIGSGAAAYFYRKPIMCNAANIGFSKKAFEEVQGFEGNENTASGDDVFLMRKMFKKNPCKVSFLKNQMAIVRTSHEYSISKFFNQRIRWAGKWNKVEGLENKLVPIFVFTFHLSTLILFALGFTGMINLIIVTTMLFFKVLAEYLFIHKVMKFFGNKSMILNYLIASLIYPFYAVIVGVAANFGSYTWKGRNFKN